MSRLNSRSREVWAKVALFGAGGSGFREVFDGISQHYANAEVSGQNLGDTQVLHTEFIWPNLLPNDWHLRMRVYGVSGENSYNAISELLLKEVDGIAFVADVSSQERLKSAVDAMKLMVFNLQRMDYDLAHLPISLLYHRIDSHEVFQPELMDQFLGIPTGSLPRFCSRSSDGPMELSAAIDVLAESIHRKLSAELLKEEEQVVE